MIEVRDLCFSYSKKVLENVNFVIRKGEMVFLLGPNGSGKTTLLKCLAGLLKPKGAVLVENVDIKKMTKSDLAKTFGYVPQRGEVSHLSVFDVVLLGRKPYMSWEPKEEDYRIVEEVLEIFGLGELATRRLTELSGGELQLVLIARAFAQRPKFILLDEPTNNLDIKNQIRVMNLLKEAVREMKISAIITTHDLNLAANFADSVILLKNGRIFVSGGLEVLRSDVVKEVYGLDVEIVRVNGRIVILPLVEFSARRFLAH